MQRCAPTTSTAPGRPRPIRAASTSATRLTRTPYGLAAAVWSADQEHAVRVARQLRAGQIEINGGAFNVAAPFGGFGQSGYGRELGVHGLEEFLELKALLF